MRTLRIVDAPPEESESANSGMPVVPPSKRQAPQAGQLAGSRPQTAAIEHIFTYAGPRQGTRIAVTGSTGSGKTWWQRKVVTYAAQRDDYVFIHDAKDRVPQYQGGAVRDSIFSLHRNPAPSNVVIFRHEDPERVADLAWRVSGNGMTATLLIDEIMDAMSAPMHWRAKAGAKGAGSRIDEIYRKGRSRGVTVIGSTQAPQWWPTVAMTQSDFKILFRMDTRSLDYAKDSLRLTNREVETIRKLAIGQFIMVQQGIDWNGVVYGPH